MDSPSITLPLDTGSKNLLKDAQCNSSLKVRDNNSILSRTKNTRPEPFTVDPSQHVEQPRNPTPLLPDNPHSLEGPRSEPTSKLYFKLDKTVCEKRSNSNSSREKQFEGANMSDLCRRPRTQVSRRTNSAPSKPNPNLSGGFSYDPFDDSRARDSTSSTDNGNVTDDSTRVDSSSSRASPATSSDTTPRNSRSNPFDDVSRVQSFASDLPEKPNKAECSWYESDSASTKGSASPTTVRSRTSEEQCPATPRPKRIFSHQNHSISQSLPPTPASWSPTSSFRSQRRSRPVAARALRRARDEEETLATWNRHRSQSLQKNQLVKKQISSPRLESSPISSPHSAGFYSKPLPIPLEEYESDAFIPRPAPPTPAPPTPRAVLDQAAQKRRAVAEYEAELDARGALIRSQALPPSPASTASFTTQDSYHSTYTNLHTLPSINLPTPPQPSPYNSADVSPHCATDPAHSSLPLSQTSFFIMDDSDEEDSIFGWHPLRKSRERAAAAAKPKATKKTPRATKSKSKPKSRLKPKLNSPCDGLPLRTRYAHLAGDDQRPYYPFSAHAHAPAGPPVPPKSPSAIAIANAKRTAEEMGMKVMWAESCDRVISPHRLETIPLEPLVVVDPLPTKAGLRGRGRGKANSTGSSFWKTVLTCGCL